MKGADIVAIGSEGTDERCKRYDASVGEKLANLTNTTDIFRTICGKAGQA